METAVVIRERTERNRTFRSDETTFRFEEAKLDSCRFVAAVSIEATHVVMEGCLFDQDFDIRGCNVIIVNCVFKGRVLTHGRPITFTECIFDGGLPLDVDAFMEP